jgi:polyketide cyclase/dehydrase/lipid transport protein
MAEFTYVRETHIDADPARVHALINDFHNWTQWSPWEDVDPRLDREYSGPDQGVGTRYAWRGNRKAGEGAMEIVGSNPQQIDIRLSFLKPWRAENDVTFAITPDNGGSDVSWSMSGENKGLTAVFAKVFNMEKLLGKDFEKGLARLKAVAES